jgi:hypothetical protein
MDRRGHQDRPLRPRNQIDHPRRFDHHDERLDLRLDRVEQRLQAEFQRDLRVTALAVLHGNAASVSVAAALTNLGGGNMGYRAGGRMGAW